ncbi:MAG: YegP family protein [Arthrobacter sp.]
MTGGFEVFLDTQLRFRFRLVDADGAVLAVSCPYAGKREAAAGIAAVRECAGMGLITDLSGPAPARCGHQERPGARVPRTPYRPEVLDIVAS